MILIIWLYVVCDLLLKGHLQVPTFSEFVDYVVKETTGLESPKDWKVTNCWYKTRRCQRNSIRLPLFQLPALVVENWYMVVKRGGLRSWDFFLVYGLNHLPKYQNPFLGYLFFIVMSLQPKKTDFMSLSRGPTYWSTSLNQKVASLPLYIILSHEKWMLFNWSSTILITYHKYQKHPLLFTHRGRFSCVSWGKPYAWQNTDSCCKCKVFHLSAFSGAVSNYLIVE